MYLRDIWQILRVYHQEWHEKSRMSQKFDTARKLKLSTPLLSQQLVLTVTENTAQPIYKQVKNKDLSIPANEEEFNQKL